MGEGRLAEETFLGVDIGFRERLALRSDFDVAFASLGKTEQGGGFDDGKQVVHLEMQIVGDVIQVLLAAAIDQEFERDR